MITDPDTPCAGYRITVEAVGLTQGHAAAYALRLMADMIQAPTLQGHSCGGNTGKAVWYAKPGLAYPPKETK